MVDQHSITDCKSAEVTSRIAAAYGALQALLRLSHGAVLVHKAADPPCKNAPLAGLRPYALCILHWPV
jgi:hypothetical protein